MKRIIALLILTSMLLACEDVIDVEVPTEAPRLSVDALIRVDESEPTINLVFKATLTNSFFEPISPAQLEQISLVNLDLPADNNSNIRFPVETVPGSGIYEVVSSVDFLRQGELLLQIRHEGQSYLATTRYVPTVPIDKLVQGNETLFDDEDTEVEITFTDNPDREDFYVFDFGFGEFLVTEDEFFQGQEFQFSYFYDKNLRVGQEVNISILGADRLFFNYMDKLIEQGGVDMGPFATPAATVRGNIFNVTDLDNVEVFDNVGNPNNFALGYFAVVQEFKQSLVIE